MENWQFLIQKEGDRAWLPIHQSTVPLESGRYRLVAQSSRQNQQVKLRVIHQSTEENPPKKRSLTRSRRTTPEGLMVVIPYTSLKPGLWEFSCAGEVPSEDSLQPWEEKVQLQVGISQNQKREEVQAESVSEIALESTVETETPTPEAQSDSLESLPQKAISETPETSLESPTSEENESVQALIAEIEDWGLEGQTDLPQKDEETVNLNNTFLETSLQDLEYILQQEIDPLLRDESEDKLPPPVDDFAASPLDEVVEIANQVDLHFDTDEFMGSLGETISLSGQIEKLDSDLSLDNISEARLRYQLRNPQDRKLLQETQHPLCDFTLPYAFNHKITLEENLQSRLLLGDAIIEVKFAASESFSAIASQSFTITLEVSDVSELLNTVFPPVSSQPETQDNPTPKTKQPAKIKFFDPSKRVNVTSQSTTKIENSPQKLVSASIISPKISRPGTSKSFKSLQLPKLPSPPPVATDEPKATITIDTIEKQLQLSSASKSPVEADSVNGNKSQIQEIKLQSPKLTETSEATVEITAGEENEEELLPAIHSTESSIILESQKVEEDTSERLNNSEETNNLQVTEESWDIPTPEAKTSPLVEAFPFTEESPDIPTSETGILPPTEASPARQEAISQGNGEKVNVEDSFQSLSLQKRFLERLNVLAKETDSLEWLQDEPESAETVEETATEENSIETQLAEEDSPSLTDESEIDEWGEAISLSSEVRDSFDDIETVNWEGIPEVTDFFPEEELIETPANRKAEITEWEEAMIPLLSEEEILAAQNKGEESEKIELTPTLDEWEDVEESEKIELTSPSETWEEANFLKGESHDFLLEEWDEGVEISSIATEETSNEEAEETWVEESNFYTNPADDWNNLEVVVDDEEVIISEPTVTPRDTSGLPYPAQVIPPQRQSPLLSRQRLEISVPTPVLTISEDNLTAGETVMLKVKLAPYTGSVYVKLWIQDRQNRAILDGPRALVEFDRSSTGELTTLTQLTVPLGTMEVQFEAIAIDTQTQQESHKAVVDKVIIPSDLPGFSLDEFEV